MNEADHRRVEPAAWQNNLAALGDVDAGLASALAGLRLPETVESAIGKDGEPTYRIAAEGAGMRWFGRTSMPSVSGPATLDNFDAGSGNVLLPRVGQGIEMKLLLDRLPAHRAVFVLEHDLLALALAFRLYDVGEAIRWGRLVVLTGAESAEALRAFLTNQPGYVIPERILGWPWLSQADHQRIRLEMERAAALTVKARSEYVERLRGDVGKLAFGGLSDPPRCVLLGLDASEATGRRAIDLLTAIERLGWDCASCLADRPAHGMSTAHGETVLRHRPDFAVLINHFRGQYGGMLPEGLSVASVLSANVPADATALRSMGPGDLVFVESPETHGRLIDGGGDASRILALRRANSRFACVIPFVAI